MTTVAVIQARMASSRLPGKVMLPLGGVFALEHVARRIGAATEIDNVVIATSTHDRDDIIAWCAERIGMETFRGDESDVLGRMYHAADAADADEVVRVTGDCPLIDPDIADAVICARRDTHADYATNHLERTFPRGLDVTVLTCDSLALVHREADNPFQREHIEPYYHQNADDFHRENVTSDAVFDEPWMRNRNDLRLTLDEVDDYKLLREIYEEVPYDNLLDIRDVVQYIDDHGRHQVNQAVEHDP